MTQPVLRGRRGWERRAAEPSVAGPGRRVPDLSKAEKMIGYKPRHTLDDILNEVIDYFRRK